MHDALIVPGDNLVTEDIPPIPRTLADEVERYADFRPTGFAGWHPSERSMLVVRRAGHVVQIHRLDAPNAPLVQITHGDEPVNEAMYAPVSDAPFILFGQSVGGNENTQYYRVGPDGGEPCLVTDGISRNVSAQWSHSGDRLAYNSTRRNGRDADLYVADPFDPAGARLVAELDGYCWSCNWSHDGRSVLIGQGISRGESYIWIVDVETGAMRNLTPVGEEGLGFFGGGTFAPDDRSIIALSNCGSEFTRLVSIDVATCTATTLFAAEWDVEYYDVTHDGRLVALVLNVDGRSTLQVLDIATRTIIASPALPPGTLYDVQWHRERRELGFTLESSALPAAAYSYDLDSGELVRWTQPDLNGHDPDTFVEPELIRWTSFDGMTISGWLHRPPSHFTGPRPVIVNIHGGPEGQARAGFMGRMNYWIIELGIAVIEPNVRGSTGYGKTFVTLDDGFRREDSYEDIGALLDWIADDTRLDHERIMVMGGSYGGHMTLATAVRYPEKIRCAIDVVGISHFVTFLTNTADYRRDIRRAEYGDERDPEMRAFMERIAPLNNAESITKPILIVQGANDPRVPLGEAEQMVARLRAIGTPVWYLMAKDEGHGFRKKINRDFEFYAGVTFVRQFLL